MSRAMEEMVVVPAGLRLRASVDDSARWAAAVAGIPLEAELVAAARPRVPFGAVLLGVAQRVGASIGARLEATFPALVTAQVDDEVAVAAIEWLRDQADGFASAALGFARSMAEGESDAVAA